MIISHKHRYIFIKTNKTAGTSVEIALSKYCGPDDIITPISPEDEIIREKMQGRPPQHFHHSGVNSPGDYFNHIGASDIKAKIGDEIWQSYFKFCIERNPFDRVISHYFWIYKSGPRPTLSEYLQTDQMMALKSKGFQLYTLNGKIAVDKVCLYENLNEELEAIRLQLGIDDKLELPQAKSKFRKDKRSYREILNESDRNIISEIFADEIRLFDYRF